VVFLPSVGLLPLNGAEEKLSLSVGFASADITPKVGPKEKPVWLAGFGKGRKATGVADPLYARATVWSDGKKKIAIVSVDLVGLFYDPCMRIRAALPGFDYVVVSSTHNHEGPDTMGLWGPNALTNGIDPDYLAFVEKTVVQTIREADKAQKKVTARLGTILAPELLHDSRKPIILHDELVVLRFQDATGKNVGVVVQWNNHPETLDDKNTLVSADYVGYTVKHLEKSQNCPVVYLTGTVGGLMTSLRVEVKNEKGESLKDGTFEKTARYGELLGIAAEKALSKAKPVTLTPFGIHRSDLYLPLDNKLYAVAKQLGVLQREAYLWQEKMDEAKPVEEFDPRKRHAVKTELAYLQLGELSVACIPGEIYPELVLDKVVEKAEPEADFPDAPREPGIYKQMPGPYRMIIGLANDELGYFLPKRQWDEKPPYAYGLKKPPYGEVNSLGPDTGPLLCEAFAKLARGK
jgi:hypothetical protein